MSDYKHTLNLPQTDFPMKANLAEREPAWCKTWQEQHLYQAIRDARKGRPLFVMHDGPPYANGHLHVGHALNKTLKDIIVKSKTLSNYDAAFIPGWDCHGLPIEHQVEKKHGKPGQKLSHAEFRKACREYAASQIDVQRGEFIRMGVIADWYHPYITMDFHYEADIIRSLAKIIAKGHLKKGYRPVHWCLDCASALAEAEVEYADKTSSSIDVAFVAEESAELLQKLGLGASGINKLIFPIWTTTPWTLPANQAVSLHPTLSYCVMQKDHTAYVLVEDLKETALIRYGALDATCVLSAPGETFAGVRLKHPFYERTVPLVLGDHVTVDAGTGLVHTAPAHGEIDFDVGARYDLPLENPVGDDGCYISTTPLLAGTHVTKAEAPILALLRENETLLYETKITHSFPHCWRHKTPLIFRATPQWFVSMDQAGLRTETLAAIGGVSWVPEWGQARILQMIANRPDWCISRQRVWGVPLALFTHKETDALHPDTEKLMQKVAEYVEKEGIDAWFKYNAETFLGKDAAHYQKVNDVLDVWFDSGVTHECVLRENPALHFPADVILEGSDQHRGWFHSLLLTSIAMNDVAPYRTVLTHGYTVDGEGRKMSKSLGNIIAPDEVMNKLGADMLRLWAASTDYRSEVSISQEILNRNVEAYRRIRNTARFLLANLHDFDPTIHLQKPADCLALDQYMLRLASRLQKEIQAAYDSYQFHLVVQKIQQFCINELGGFYLDIIKDRQYTLPKNSKARRSAQTALYHIAHAFVRWLAPILSFTAEEMWQHLPNTQESSVFLALWYDNLSACDELSESAKIDWNFVRLLRDVANKEIERLRKESVIGSALEAKVTLYVSKDVMEKLEFCQNELAFVFITSEAVLLPESEKTEKAIATDIPGVSLVVEKIKHSKCVRCWHRREDVGAHALHPELCGRCVTNITTPEGEERHYA